MLSNFKKKLPFIFMMTLLTLVITACQATDTEPKNPEPNPVVEEPSTDTNETDSVTKEPDAMTEEPEELEEVIVPFNVVTTLFPQYDFARAIAGPYADITLLLPPGVESHSYEPTPQDIVNLQNADLFLYTGADMEPWTEGIVENLESSGVRVVDLSQDIVLLTIEDHDDHHHGDDHGHDENDPHYWTDPNMAMIMVANIVNAFKETNPERSEYFEAKSIELTESLTKLDADIRAMLEKTESKTILSGGHFAFGYFVAQYDLNHMSPYAGFSPSAEPTPQRIATLIKNARETGAKAVFYEELVEPRVAEVIADEANLEMLLLHGIHNISKEELEAGKTYFDFMTENIENLKIGLGYNE